MDKRIFVDKLTFDSKKKEYVLKRKYQVLNSQNLLDWCDEYVSHPERMKIVAKGITAYFSERANSFENSFRSYLHNNRPFGTSLFYQKYYDINITLLRDTDRLNPFEEDWKQDSDLIQLHIENEAKLYNESFLFFDEVMPSETSIIASIKRAALGYPEWIKHQRLIDEVEITSAESGNQPEQTSIHENEVIDFKGQIEQKLYFMQKKDPRKHELILNETDFNNLIEWVTSFFKNEFTVPEINTPIQKVNTAKGNVIYSFVSLFDELQPSATRPDSLFELIIECFYEYRNDKINNLKKSTKKPQYYDELTKQQ